MERPSSSSSSSDQRKFSEWPERVKSVDLHPTEPWILASWYSGTLCIWNYQTQALAKSLVVTELPVRSAKFIARKQWVVAGADDMYIRVYNYNTMEKVKVFEAHSNYIRCVAVHPTLPYVLSSSDDMLIKLWDWEKGWACTQIFEGHSHYVMQVTFNPKDTYTFSSASLDGTIKIWNLALPDPNFTLDAHQKGVNCIDYFTGGDKPYLITGSDDRTAKVWDYQTKSCVQTLQGHTHNVSAVYFHPELPIIITSSEDGTVCIWHATTYRLENANTLNHGLERVWAIGYTKSSRQAVIGYDEGAIMVKLGREIPFASLENTVKIIWAKHNEIQTANIKSIRTDSEVKNVDWISKLPDDVLLMILSRLSTEEAIRTSVVSKRWEHVWKQMSHLVLDMQRLINDKESLDGSIRAATLLTKVLSNHNGHLKSCVIDHFSYHGANGMLNTWIRLSTCVKYTEALTLTHHFDCLERTKAFNVLSDCFSHPSLTSLSLQGYILDTSHCFNNCQNLKTLKLHLIMGLEVGVFNRVLASCPSLQVLVLHVTCFNRCTGGPLKIENKKLKILQVSSCKDIDGFRVSAASLDILTIGNISFSRDGLVLTSPRLHEFNRISWRNKPHISYNISKERKSIVHEEFVNISGELLMETPSLSVSVDLMNPTEVERFSQVLRLWSRKMNELEILFKNNNAHREEEDESTQKKLWEENNNKDPFPNAEFRVDTVWMHNFNGSQEEFALASRLIRQGTVVKQMMIKTTSFPPIKKLEIETAVAKLQALQTQDQWWKLTIKCF